MGRIRTVKPEFFKHDMLFDAEQRTGLPLRLAFIGLWTVADREGRFRWRPRVLKLDCLPYDACDFAAVLNGLEEAGVIRRYEVDGEVYGFIPSWSKHQVINQREAKSDLPSPSDTATHVHARAEQVSARGEGKGKEREKEVVSEPNGSSSAGLPADKRKRAYPEKFEAAWAAYPTDRNMSKQEAFDAWKRLDQQDRETLEASIPGFRAYCSQNPDYRPIHMCRFIQKRRFDGFAAPSDPPTAVDDATWEKRLAYARAERTWAEKWGPMPGHDGCRVPPQLLEATDGSDWSEWREAA